MKKVERNEQDFEIDISLNGGHKTVRVSPKETTDGAEYFKCTLKGENITQIRKEKDGSWEQIWGKLDPQTVNIIGKAITGKTS
jgi:hypothetical protein